MQFLIRLVVQRAAPFLAPLLTLGSTSAVIWLDSDDPYPFDDNPAYVIRRESLSIEEAREAGWPTHRQNGHNAGQHEVSLDFSNPNVSLMDRLDMTFGNAGGWNALRNGGRPVDDFEPVEGYQWSSCESYICLAGYHDRVRIYDTYPRYRQTHEIKLPLPKRSSPLSVLTEATVAEAVAARLLTP